MDKIKNKKMERKYVKTFERFSVDFSTDLISHFDGSEITNEGLFSWIKSKFKLTSLQKGFDTANKLIEDNSEIRSELERFIEKNKDKINAVDPEDVKKLTSLVKGQSSDVEKQIEIEAEKVSEADTESKSFVERVVSILKSVLRFGAEAVWVLGSLASFVLACLGKADGLFGTQASHYITSGEAGGNLSFSVTTVGFFMGGLIAYMLWVFYKVYQQHSRHC